MPQQPRYRRDAQSRPSFSFYKYRFPVDHPDGKKGGDFLLFDIEFVVDEAVLAEVRQKLADQVAAEANRRGISPVPEVVIGTIIYTKGSTSLKYPEGLVEKQVPNGAPPSLFGNNACTFALELPPEGATFLEEAMQGQGGAVSVVHDLWFWARIPDEQITAGFKATNFYSYYQTIDTDWSVWAEDDYRETIREQLVQSESLYFHPVWGGVSDPKVQTTLRDWALWTVDDAVERKMITRDITNTQISSFSLNYTESQAVEWHHAPQGILPNITTLTDASGTPIKWSDYARTIDLDDLFFKTLRVNASSTPTSRGCRSTPSRSS